MSSLRRIADVVLGLVMIACSVILMLDPEDGLPAVAAILGAWLMIYGLRELAYYLTMARHMVGGLSILIIAVIAIDMGVTALALSNESRFAIMLYLVGLNAFTGITCILHAAEAKELGSRWTPTLAHGVVSLVLVVCCLVFMRSDRIIMAILCFGLVYGAIVRIVAALRPAKIVYIQ